MKMETVIRSPQKGVVAKLVHKEGDICKAGTVLVLFEEVISIFEDTGWMKLMSDSMSSNRFYIEFTYDGSVRRLYEGMIEKCSTAFVILESTLKS